MRKQVSIVMIISLLLIGMIQPISANASQTRAIPESEYTETESITEAIEDEAGAIEAETVTEALNDESQDSTEESISDDLDSEETSIVPKDNSDEALLEESDLFSDESNELENTEEVEAVSRAGISISSATSISVGSTYSGSITSTNTADYYKFTIASSGRVTLTATAGMNWISYYIYDSSGNQLQDIHRSWNSTTQLINTSETIDLKKGTYYFAVRQYSAYTGDYSFKLSFASASESFIETDSNTNNSMNNASSISFNKSYNGQLAINDDKDFYKFTISSSGRITLTASASMNWISYYIYDSSGNQLRDIHRSWNSTTQLINTSETIDLTKGTYYFAVQQYSSYTGNYSFKLSFASASESFAETGTGTDNSIYSANNISINTTYKGQLAINDEKDFYKFTLSSTSKLTFTATASMTWISYYIYDSSGNQIWDIHRSWNSTNEKINISETIDLSKGTYYLCVHQYSSYTGPYSFSLRKYTSLSSSAVSLSASSYTYNGKAKKPTVKVKLGSTVLKSGTDYTVSYSANKNVGTAKVTIKGKGNYSGTVTKSFTIKPKATTITKLTKKSKGFTVKWKKQKKQVTGYQIQYSKSSKFSGGTKKKIKKNTATSYTFKKLNAKKKYYVRIRTYKVVSGKTYYSSWSASKSVTTKK